MKQKKISKDTKATIRCIPFNQDTESLKCIYSDTQAKYQVIFTRILRVKRCSFI